MKNENKHGGCKNSNYGKCWIIKDGKSITIEKELLEQYLNNGWVKGRKIQNTENIKRANSNRFWVNKDGVTKFINKEYL